jgi:hypothetical protein
LVECNLLNASPDPDFTSVEDCKQVDSVKALFDYATAEGGACEEAVMSYYECFAETACREFPVGLGVYLPFCDEPRLSQPEIDCPDFFSGGL